MSRESRRLMRTAPPRFIKTIGIQRMCLDCGRVSRFRQDEILNRFVKARCWDCGSTCMGPVPRKRYERRKDVLA